ncbi:MAG: F0F1 ATP synthase subunit B [Paludibacteraceae bacterium]|jgi:F-type H+-transporting ATPase subunit b|nr:F0F1 ATP synthase subunit B [Paludibacteraceae bacterium]OQA50565.1 MAG: ATP synthase subunit b [Bacteroidetes bacterium ADurb.Bin302]HPG55819.1 F0F1 ATP synthase subunit B [Candidatus Enterocola sp.]
MNLFLPESGLVIWMLLAFSIVFFVLAKFAWPSILKSIQQRQEYISDSLVKANEAIQTLSGLEQKGKQIIADAQAEQLRMVKETKALNDKMVAEAKEQAKIEAEKIIENAHDRIRLDKEHAILEIRKEIAGLTISIAEKILKKELEDKQAQSQYINRLLKESADDIKAS